MEDQGGSIRRPAQIANPHRDFLRLAAICGDEIHFPGFARHYALEGDLLTIGGPTWPVGSHGSKGELQPLASIHLTFPEISLGDTRVSHPLSIIRESHTFGRHSRHVRHELLGFHIVTSEFAALLPTYDKELFVIPARKRPQKIHRTCRQLHWFLIRVSE